MIEQRLPDFKIYKHKKEDYLSLIVGQPLPKDFYTRIILAKLMAQSLGLSLKVAKQTGPSEAIKRQWPNK